MATQMRETAELHAVRTALASDDLEDAAKVSVVLWSTALLWRRAAGKDGTLRSDNPAFDDLMDVLACASDADFEVIRPYAEPQALRGAISTMPALSHEMRLGRPEEARVWDATVGESPLAVTQWDADGACIRLVAVDDFSDSPHVTLAAPEDAASYENVYIPWAREAISLSAQSRREIADAPEEGAEALEDSREI